VDFGILHRYAISSYIRDQINYLVKNNAFAVPSIGIQDEDLAIAESYAEAGASAICIDVAHSDTPKALKMIKAVSKFATVIAGNVATYSGAYGLASAGAKMIKVGIGNGAACSTRVVTGHGIPQLTAIYNTSFIKLDFPEVKICADGGCKTSGDIVKAIAAGADFVMLGSMLAGTDESPGQVLEENGQKYKVYKGMASKEAQIAFRGKVNNKAPEGVSGKVPYVGSVSDLLEELAGGIRSGFSYSGASNCLEFKKKATFVRITPSGYYEGTPNILNRR
jgi:IMP dehydrogenase